jgi:predicted nucleotidyltransferase
MMLPLIEQHRTEISALCRRFGVRRLAVFGSAARGTDFDPARSDVDLLYQFEAMSSRAYVDAYFDLKEALERLFNRPVDLVSQEAIETSRNYIRRKSILKQAEPIYG